ncbi:hypothetical protein [Thalassobacillus sp. CUG 92003]|uniref:hypothetical protein n=1 Tax=Thalassobacillus sp. CUG 92003 TaxID=2736641 RepID=UPI0015E7B8A2|nr:hypothetical protein [Thalassobacillus sp. CUG 92003]
MQASAAGLFKSLHHAIDTKGVTKLKPGQLVSGKVQKLLPNNQAVVTIAGNEIKAVLETPLNSGNSYFFQVQSTAQSLHLKVVSQQALTQDADGLARLLTQMGEKATTENLQLLRQLRAQSISFQKNNLSAALRILQGSPSPQQAIKMIVHMMKNQWPINNATYQAVQAKQTTQLSTLISQLSHDLDGMDSSSRKPNTLLLNRLHSLTGGSRSGAFTENVLAQVVSDTAAGKPSSFHVLKAAGLVDEQLRFADFQRTMLKWTNQQGVNRHTEHMAKADVLQYMNGHQAQSFKASPILLHGQNAESALQSLMTQQLPITQDEMDVLRQFTQQLSRLAKQTSHAAMSQKMLTNLTFLSNHHVINKLGANPGVDSLSILTTLPEMVNHQPLNSLQTQDVQRLVQQLQSVLTKQLSGDQHKQLIDWLSKLGSEAGSHKEMVYVRMKAMLELTGLDDEFQLRQHIKHDQSPKIESSMKSLLLQFMQESDSAVRPERVQQLIHLLNGLQMTASQESSHSLHLSLQFPGDLMDANQDIFVDIEGGKNEHGEIDPDFCHILFYLQLNALQETVIDMNVHNRRVHLTVFNANTELSGLLEAHQQALQDGLDRIGYTLGSVKWKDFNEASRHTPAGRSSIAAAEHVQGVDFRI